MTQFIVKSPSKLWPDPDENSVPLADLNVGDKVDKLNELGPWWKVSVADQVEQKRIGWSQSANLGEITASSIDLFDEPLGNPRHVVGDIIARGTKIESWLKVTVQLTTGAQDKGWIHLDPPAEGGTDAATTETAEEQVEAALTLGANEPYRAPLLRAQEITGIDAAALAALIDAEAAKLPSGQWNSKSKAGTSSASGLTQFLDSTWLSHAQKTGTTLNDVCKKKNYLSPSSVIVSGRSADILQLRFDPELSIISAAEFGASNLDALIQLGLVDDEIGDDEKARFIYMAHHEGLGGAKAILKGTDSHTYSDLKTQVGFAKAKAYVDAVGGDTTKAYRNWLNDYMDQRIQPSRYRSAAKTAPVGATSDALAQFNGAPIPLSELGGKAALVKAIQWRLFELGYLDPPADGIFGPVSHWALGEFCVRNNLSLNEGMTKNVAERLISPTKALAEIAPTGSWFDKVIKYMRGQNYFICRHPRCKNIIYLEGANSDGTLNDDAPNKFNDLRIVFSVTESGLPIFEGSIWEGTTEPGKYWTVNPMNVKGAARIAFNQYKSWSVGYHHPSSPSKHEALVQVGPVTVHRDLNKDYKRIDDALDTGLFAINQHWGYDAPAGDLGQTSAGCLVGRSKDGHRAFMTLIKEDPRYKVNRSYRFVTTVMPADAVLG